MSQYNRRRGFRRTAPPDGPVQRAAESALLEVEADAALADTLGELGIAPEVVHAKPWHVLARSEPDNLDMSRTYGLVNEDLLRLVRHGPVAITHITGEARALVHPKHRTVIALDRDKGGATTVACRPATPAIVDATTFISAQKLRWSMMTWDDLIDILTLCAEGAVRVVVLPGPAPVHFSIYGDDRLQLQESHEHPSERKRVWYLQSHVLVRELRGQAAALVAQSRPLLSTSFDSLLQWLFSPRLSDVVRSERLPAGWGGDLPPTDIERLVDLGILARTGSPDAPFVPLLRPSLRSLTEAVPPTP